MGLRVVAVVAVLAGCLAFAPAALADATTAGRCVSDAEQGQKERDDGHLVESRTLFARCGAEACPTVVSRECVRWLSAVDERIPTILVVTKDENGKDLLAAIQLDGRPFDGSKVGREIQVDPGPHTLSASAAGYFSAKESVVVRERDKGRLVSLALRSTHPPPPSAAAPSPPVREARRVPALSYVLGGVALLGAGGFAYFWASGMDEVSNLRGSCSPSCSPEQIDDARTPLNLARISLGIGIAAAVGAVVVYLAAPRAAQTRAHAAPLGVWAF